MEEDGDASSNPRRLCDNIIWHMKQATFCCCPCTIDPKKGHHDPVQVLFPLKFTANFPKKAQVDLKGTGAVIFGHNMRVHWYWKDFGHPVKGDPPMEGWATIADSFEDSGIGSSLSSSRLLSTSGPSSAGSMGDKSPVQSHLSAPPSYSEIMPVREMKRTISGMISSVSKRAKR
ncbi:hypothetical protein NPX13_g1745 [Xylaria arbuscula]|uniref:Uncharacterized protein n=1 Tax=Xylaria arbuscula TaxID=114810 RepID=A0A9W8NLE1_9PEZI|nr:hypothetical protein NPX13_g1745 [Xylaria arbuscula]